MTRRLVRLVWILLAGLAIGHCLMSDASAQSETPKNLGTRKRGVDWPKFLGPSGNSKSDETGTARR